MKQKTENNNSFIMDTYASGITDPEVHAQCTWKLLCLIFFTVSFFFFFTNFQN